MVLAPWTVPAEMVPLGYNWNNSYARGNTTYSRTFTAPGINVYFDVSVSGMKGWRPTEWLTAAK